MLSVLLLCTVCRAFFWPTLDTFVPSGPLRRTLVVGAAGAVASGTAKLQPAVAQFPFSDIPAPPDVGAIPDDAEITPSGLASKVLQLPPCESEAECKAARPLKFDKVTSGLHWLAEKWAYV